MSAPKTCRAASTAQSVAVTTGLIKARPDLPGAGWTCTLPAGHDGPHEAHFTDDSPAVIAWRDPADPADQLADAVTALLEGVAALGVSDANPLTQPVRGQVRAAAEATVAMLAQDDDDRLAAEACLSVMTVLWPVCAPEDCGQAGWWRTPLGRLCARSLGRVDAESVSRSVAAAMLGVHPGTVAQLVARGTLDRHPDGGVLRASVLQRLSRQA